MSRQHAQHAVPSRPRHQAPKSSVWIDPTVSTYLQGEQAGRDKGGDGAGQEQAGHDQSGSYRGASTPIPPRASAQRLRAVRVRPRYSYARTPVNNESDLASIPTQPPPTTWQYESQEYSAESSLSSLSLIVDTPTHPQAPVIGTPGMPGTLDTPPHGMPRIEDMHTRPSFIAGSSTESTIGVEQRPIEELDTIPMQLSPARGDGANGANRLDRIGDAGGAQVPRAASLFLGDAIASASSNNSSSRALAPVVPAAMPVVIEPQNVQVATAEPASWTAGAAAGSRYAQLVAARTGRTGRKKHIPSFNIFDRMRWWLLHPGRFEFLLWLGGTMLLMAVTCIFVLMTVFSMQWNVASSNNGALSSSNGTNGTVNGQTTRTRLSLVLTNAGSLLPGQPLHLRGQGFSAKSHIALTYDANRPFLNRGGQPVVAQTDAHGTFSVTLISPSWTTGQHLITARDLATGDQKTILITVAGVITGTATATPVVVTPVATAPVTQQGNTPPIGNTPTVVPPTVGITPTATPKLPTPTPTRGITPTITPTAKASVTPNAESTATPGASVTPTVNGSATVGNTSPATIGSQDIATGGETGGDASPWLWLLIGGYTLAMLLFGFAGLARKRF